MTDMREKVARALYEHRNRGLRNVWSWEDSGLDDEHPGARQRYLDDAQAAITALTAERDALKRDANLHALSSRDDGYIMGRGAERAAVVAYLRRVGLTPKARDLFQTAAGHIEAGAHVNETP
jgi:hypothetical protein